MERIERIDTIPLGSPRQLPDGRIIVDANISRTGVFLYVRADGSISREYRPPSEVFDTESMLSFQLVPVTDEHPIGGVNSQNARRLSVGTTGENIRQNGKFLTCPIALNDEDTIYKAYSGKVEASCGYSALIDPTPGTSPDGEKYDVIHRKIRGNHVAIVDKGRAGSEVRLKMDGSSIVDQTNTQTVQDQNMSAELHAKISQLTIASALDKARADKADSDLVVEKSRADKAEADRDQLQVKADKLEETVAATKERSDSEISELVALRSDALKVLGKEFVCDDKTSRQIKEAIICKTSGASEFPKNKSDGYVDARYDGCMEVFKEKEDSSEEVVLKGMIKADAKNNSSDPDDEKKARQDMLDAREKRAQA